MNDTSVTLGDGFRRSRRARRISESGESTAIRFGQLYLGRLSSRQLRPRPTLCLAGGDAAGDILVRSIKNNEATAGMEQRGGESLGPLGRVKDNVNLSRLEHA